MGRKREILIVDNDRSTVQVIRTALEALDDISVWAFASPVAALSAFKANPSIRLVITDFRMLEMDGVEFARKIRALNRGIPIIALTAFVNALYDEEIFNEAITKPFEVEDLTRRVVAYFDNDEPNESES